MRGSLARPIVVLCAFLLVACGKKGPPLAPMVRVPAGIETIGIERLGNDVYLTLTVPLTNIDETRPVDIARVDVYGYTGRTAPPRGRFTEAATVVASVPVTTPAVAGTAPPPVAGSPGAAPAADTPPAAAPSVPGALPGARVTVLDELTPGELRQGPVLAPAAPPGSRPLPVAPEPATTGPLRRYYLAVGISSRGVPGPQGAPVDLPLFPLPDPPADVQLAATANSTVVSWEPPGGLVGFLLASPLPPEPPPGQDPFAPPRAAAAAQTPVAPAGPLTYNVYIRTFEPVTPSGAAPSGAAAPQAAATPPAQQPPWALMPPSPINPVPLTETEFLDAVEFGRERCYRVRTLRGTPPNVLVSEPSEESCITAVDTFPPAPPAGLAAVAGEESISLIWEFGSDPDLAGYVVLRGEPGDATLQPLTASPIEGASFVDENVTAGRRFVYAVIAVDAAGNRSAESVRVEETAR